MLQDILFHAGISPKRKAAELNQGEIDALYTAVRKTIDAAVKSGGRCCERNIYDHPGDYAPLMDKSTAGKPCPACGETIQKISYLGGSCYICPKCQV
jgi:formamidopyrimidine-DNA glycosylase